MMIILIYTFLNANIKNKKFKGVVKFVVLISPTCSFF